MTHGQLVRRLTAIVSTLKQLRDRIDAITLEAQVKQTPKGHQPKVAPKAKSEGKRQPRASAIGRAIVYGGEKGKVVERKGNKFVCEMANGKRKQVSAVYVYRQLSRKAQDMNESLKKVAKKLKAEIESPEMAAAVNAPVPVAGAHDVAEDVAATVIAEQQKSA
jgi:hypothetical protein